MRPEFVKIVVSVGGTLVRVNGPDGSHGQSISIVEGLERLTII